MKKLFALLLVLIMPLALAACGGKEGTGSGGASKSGGKTPSPKFSGAYQYNPPKDTYFIKWQDFEAAGKEYRRWVQLCRRRYKCLPRQRRAAEILRTRMGR